MASNAADAHSSKTRNKNVFVGFHKYSITYFVRILSISEGWGVDFVFSLCYIRAQEIGAGVV